MQNLRNSTAALLEADKNVARLESQKLALAEEAATFGLQEVIGVWLDD
jgi:hypothetical protein